MLIYSVIMFLAAVLLSAFGIAIYRDKTDLIHSYHRTKVTDRAAYGQAFGKALFVFAAAPLFSGIIGLFGDYDRRIAVAAVAALIVILMAGMVAIVAVQKKYNRGIF